MDVTETLLVWQGYLWSSTEVALKQQSALESFLQWNLMQEPHLYMDTPLSTSLWERNWAVRTAGFRFRWWSHGLEHTRLPWPSPTPRACSNSCLSSRWWPSNHLILYCPLFLLPSIFLRIRVFSSESALHIRWPKDWSFSFSISPSNEYLGLISFRMDWLDLLAVQGTLKSLLQYHSSKTGA